MNNYCIIMAGGIGSRFWPLSKDNYPKQFLDILCTGKSFIQSTYERFSPVIPDENFLVVTNKAYKQLVLEHLPMLKPDQVLCEPARRNTAPCIAYACRKIAMRYPDADVVVMTTPDLQKYHIKRSLVRDDIEYVYMDHAINSVNLTYQKGALDAFDTVFIPNALTAEEIRAAEKLYGTKEKTGDAHAARERHD